MVIVNVLGARDQNHVRTRKEFMSNREKPRLRK